VIDAKMLNFQKKIAESSRRQRMQLLPTMLKASLKQYLKTHADQLPKSRPLPLEKLTLRNVLVTDATVLLLVDKSPNPTPLRDIICLHGGKAQKERVLNCFDTHRLIATTVKKYAIPDDESSFDKSGDNSEDEPELQVDWNAELETILEETKQTTKRARQKKPSDVAPAVPGRRGRPPKTSAAMRVNVTKNKWQSAIAARSVPPKTASPNTSFDLFEKLDEFIDID
jgi:hypothetical protein